ncbi:hypothetical protein [Evansella cellulosilytica]|uniref:Uncharacterized protein n=1 Tax=Evansella cellulosilytica (strain ATCC 21833 / DSM 2522 / FERM P-1141 / JCM 9156 / N-4) TaxID=649639 RepID=E6TXH1_EVAC2|nr:hypothetical protein [Evansella cellulosilytica]ADU28785.1 hypothetical protein Bcell_0503 [Evansella cellulosilytica DSM 2522]
MSFDSIFAAIFILLLLGFLSIMLIKKVKNKKVLLLVPFILVFTFALTYIPHSVVSMNPSGVSKITIFDGNTGSETVITEKDHIEYIITDLSDVTFQKGKSSFGYMGYSFNTKIYNEKGKVVKELIINSEDTIRYKGFFYTAKDELIDYDYIKNLVDN